MKPIKFLQLSPASQHDRERERDTYREREIKERGRSFVMEKEMGGRKREGNEVKKESEKKLVLPPDKLIKYPQGKTRK